MSNGIYYGYTDSLDHEKKLVKTFVPSKPNIVKTGDEKENAALAVIAGLLHARKFEELIGCDEFLTFCEVIRRPVSEARMASRMDMYRYVASHFKPDCSYPRPDNSEKMADYYLLLRREFVRGFDVEVDVNEEILVTGDEVFLVETEIGVSAFDSVGDKFGVSDSCEPIGSGLGISIPPVGLVGCSEALPVSVAEDCCRAQLWFDRDTYKKVLDALGLEYDLENPYAHGFCYLLFFNAEYRRKIFSKYSRVPFLNKEMWAEINYEYPRTYYSREAVRMTVDVVGALHLRPEYARPVYGETFVEAKKLWCELGRYFDLSEQGSLFKWSMTFMEFVKTEGRTVQSSVSVSRPLPVDPQEVERRFFVPFVKTARLNVVVDCVDVSNIDWFCKFVSDAEVISRGKQNVGLHSNLAQLKDMLCQIRRFLDGECLNGGNLEPLQKKFARLMKSVVNIFNSSMEYCVFVAEMEQIPVFGR